MYDLVAVVIHCGSGPNRGHCKYSIYQRFNLNHSNYTDIVQYVNLFQISRKYFSDISIVKSCGFWLIFDDDLVDVSNSSI